MIRFTSMAAKKARVNRRGEPPTAVKKDDLKQKRDAFLHTFFKRGAALTDELVASPVPHLGTGRGRLVRSNVSRPSWRRNSRCRSSIG